MKKIYVSIIFCLVGITMFAQPVGRQRVIVEIGTGTWCTYCPGAAMGADDLVENGCLVGVVEYHNGDPFTNDASNYRNSYYGVSGYPTAHFDGVLEYVGGSHTESMYPNYLPLYQQRIAIPSDFTIDIYGENTGSTYNVQLVVNQTNGNWGNLTVHLALTESEIVYSWQGQDHLNFVERLMAPTHMGTVVDFSGTDEATIDLSFTMESSWVAANCELVAWVQNEATKEILQGNMVSIPNLQPMQATAQFTCDDLTPCITTGVDFQDQSMGEVISWNWTFEGGTPATSTAQHPTVNYNTQGEYDVQLIVYDGEVYDTLLNSNYILVITAPQQPPVPSGPSTICQDYTNITYSIPTVQWATTYQWIVEPAAAGTISGPDPVATFTLAPGYLGNYTIKVRADNDCGPGTWSPGLNCTAYLTPAQFTLSDGAGYCEGGDGIELILDGSEQGVSYELYLDNDPTGIIEAGTGASISFGNVTEQGIYACLAFTDHCDNAMVGNSYVFVIYPPAEPAAPSGPATQCNNITGTTYTTSSVTGATSYTWTLVPTGAGTITGNTTTATVDWNADYSGTAQITVAAVNSCFTGPVSDSKAVSVSEAPEPAVSGEQEVCDWEPGMIYTTAWAEGSTYEWEIWNGQITAGAGTNEITVTWQNPGEGWVRVTESNNACAVTTADYPVVINDCVGIGEENQGAFNIYPNPVRNELVISFASGNSDSRVMILNQLGQVMADWMTNGNSQVTLNTSDLAAGIYIVRVIGDQSVSEKKLIRVN